MALDPPGGVFWEKAKGLRIAESRLPRKAGRGWPEVNTNQVVEDLGQRSAERSA